MLSVLIFISLGDMLKLICSQSWNNVSKGSQEQREGYPSLCRQIK
jgi:hypothetical protein